MYGVILSVCITLYVYFVMKSLTVKIKLSLRWSACVSVVFLLLNFLILEAVIQIMYICFTPLAVRIIFIIQFQQYLILLLF